MKQTIVIIGIGELGGVFARGFLRCGHPVCPVIRETDINEAAHTLPDPALVLVAVAEGDLHPTLDAVPGVWKNRLGLLQNELLPRDWEAHGLEQPTVTAIWFEKKKGRDVKVLLPSPVYGPRAALLTAALAAVDIPARPLIREEELVYELVRKNVYILTTNIAGLVAGGTVSELWARHRDLARAVAEDVMTIQDHLVATPPSHERLLQGMLEAFAGDPGHRCMGRSAPLRLQRALALADAHGLAVPTLRKIAHDTAR
ncbi:MAG TPA: hypothetical protein ENJ19_02845 [Gammaproteobacteria bacterium]|nr:hypothetical protein [Gammaproteobacteria bacterium]